MFSNGYIIKCKKNDDKLIKVRNRRSFIIFLYINEEIFSLLFIIFLILKIEKFIFKEILYVKK